MNLTSKVFLTLTVLYAFMIFYLSSLSNPGVPGSWLILLNSLMRYAQHSNYIALFAPLYPLIKQPDKALHFLLYFGFGILLFLSFKGMYGTVGRAAIIAFFLGALYGASDEFHQMFVAGRTASKMDFMADAAGLLFAQASVLLLYMLMSLFAYIYTRLQSKL